MTRPSRLIIGLVVAGELLIGWGIPHATQAAFNINNGIVGNLAYQCRELGNCNWCDFIGLMVVLQKVILSLFGGLALIMLVWGGQGIITAAGSQEKISHAKGIITSTLLGVALVLAAYFIINIVVGILITPRGQPLKTDLFGNSWWQAQCTIKDKTSPDFCRSQSDGTPCGNGGVDQVCVNDQCTVSCAGIQADSGGVRQGTCVSAGPCAPPATASTNYCAGGFCCVQ